MPTDIQTLMEMGFPENRAVKALAKTGNSGVQVAMEWLFSHADDPDIDEPYEPPKGSVLGSAETMDTTSPPAEGGTAGASNAQPTDATEAGDGHPQVAKSLKCDECGKLLKSELEAQAHAARTKHSSFSESTDEIKPLTDEEKKDQLEKLQGLLKQRRLEKEDQAKKEQISKEKMRRATGKDLVSAKQKMEEDEIKKLAEQRRREKNEEKLAKKKIMEEIEKDKRERAARMNKSSQQGQATPPAAQPAQPVAVAPHKDYSQCRLQIRMTNGQALTQSFSVKEPLAAVRLYIEMNRTDGSEPFNLMTTFPKKIFTLDDMEKPLSELGLVPSAVLVLSKIR